MHIIPVIDLMGGEVVHAIAGERSQYHPIQTVLTNASTPRAIGRALRDSLQASSTYVADLDAIGGAPFAWDAYHSLSESGLRLWLDAGISSPEQANHLMTENLSLQIIDRLILGLESIPQPTVLQQVISSVGTDACVFSLDLRAGAPIVQADGWQGYTAVDIVDVAVNAGVSTIIVLDLAQVGTGQGVGTVKLCQQLSQRWPDVSLVAGGGIRHLSDLEELEDSGCHAALIASALHDGRLTRSMLLDAGHAL